MHHETVMKVLERTLKENKPIAYSKMKVTGALQETLEKLMGEYVETMESEQTRLTMKYATDRKLANNLLERVAKQNRGNSKRGKGSTQSGGRKNQLNQRLTAGHQTGTVLVIWLILLSISNTFLGALLRICFRHQFDCSGCQQDKSANRRLRLSHYNFFSPFPPTHSPPFFVVVVASVISLSSQASRRIQRQQRFRQPARKNNESAHYQELTIKEYRACRKKLPQTIQRRGQRASVGFRIRRGGLWAWKR
jgi:hypothetical protein